MRHALLLLLLALQDSGVGALVDKAIADAKLKEAKLGVVILSPSGEVLHQRGGADVLTLASNSKVLTTSCALAKLGAGYTFKTTVGLVGNELHVFGGGDPNISGRFFDDDPAAVFKGWAKKLVDRKATKLDAIVLHAGFFDRTYLHSDWVAAKYDQDAWWCAPVGALSLNDNCVDLLYEAGEQAGDPVKITVRPATAYVTLANKATTGEGKPFGFVRRDGTNDIVANGSLAVGTKQRVAWVAIQDPAKYFGTVLKETLTAAGIACGEVREAESLLKDHKGLDVVTVHESALDKTVRVCNSVSQNFYAEMICKTLGATLKGAGTSEAGAAAIVEWLGTIGIEDVTMADGSGLSPKNRGTAASLAKVLQWWRKQKDFKAFADSLAVSGTEPGTLRKRMASIKGKVRAKTGHIDGVAALSGYVESAGGETLVFSLLVNGWKGGSADRFQDLVCEQLSRLK